MRLSTLAFAALCVCAGHFPLLAQTDEIQVYDAEIADKGKFNLMMHNNFTPNGRKEPDYVGGITPNHSYNSVFEWAYGVTDWFEAGLYMPLFTSYSDSGASFNGYKFRALFVKPHAAEQKFFYGMNFEFSFNQNQWDARKYTSEIRPIIGLHLKPVDIIVNPILDNAYLHGLKGLDFAPAGRVAYNINDAWAVAAEQYADFGTLRDFQTRSQQFQETWAVVDHKGKTYSIETGIGFGLTGGADKVTLKFMIARDLN
jgi:hypothetical protein